jgi:hypothetical protein
MSYNALDIFFFLLVPVAAWYVLRYAAYELSKRQPTEEDWRRLAEAHAFLGFSANHNRALRVLAIATISACMCTAMLGFQWPVPVGLMIAGFAVFGAGISWVYYLDFWTKRK